MASAVPAELIPDDEYALWEQALAHAEQHRATAVVDNSTSLLSSPAKEVLLPDQTLDVDIAPKLPDLEDFGLKANRLAKYRSFGLFVTDITSSEWCQQKVAFELSAHLKKVGFPAGHSTPDPAYLPHSWLLCFSGRHGNRSNGCWHCCACSFRSRADQGSFPSQQHARSRCIAVITHPICMSTHLVWYTSAFPKSARGANNANFRNARRLRSSRLRHLRINGQFAC